VGVCISCSRGILISEVGNKRITGETYAGLETKACSKEGIMICEVGW
jgi:hypothetical protein